MISKLIQTAITFGKVLLRSSFRLRLNKITSPDIVVLANGPSLKNDIINNEKLFTKAELAVVNSFCLSAFFFQLKPRYYFLLDHAFFADTNRLESVERTFQVLVNEVDWEMELHVPYRSKRSALVKALSQKNNFKIQYINYIPAKGGFSFANYWLYNLDLATPQCQNVVGYATFVLIRRAAKRIFLFGAENDWHLKVTVDKDNWLTLKDDHIYEKSEESKTIRLYSDSAKTKRRTMVELLASSVKVFSGYFEIAAYAEKQDTKIYNCSKNSYIDAFERLDDSEFQKVLSTKID